MNFIDWPLTAGANNKWNGSGRYFRILSGSGEISIEVFYKGGKSRKSKILPGIGIDLRSDEGDGFIGIDFVSPITQGIKFLASDFPTDDSRLVGDIAVSGSINTSTVQPTSRALATVTPVSATATQLLPANVLRDNASMYFSVDSYLGVDNTVTNANGFFIPAGSDISDKNTAALWVYQPVGGPITIFEGRK